jgi:hypothetical protein
VEGYGVLVELGLTRGQQPAARGPLMAYVAGEAGLKSRGGKSSESATNHVTVAIRALQTFAPSFSWMTHPEHFFGFGIVP